MFVMKLPTISTEQLRASDVPASAAPWRNVGRFASTFDLAGELPGGSSIAGVTDVSGSESLPLLGCALYVEWRRYNHFGSEPDRPTLEQIRRVLDLIRLRLESRAA